MFHIARLYAESVHTVVAAVLELRIVVRHPWRLEAYLARYCPWNVLHRLPFADVSLDTVIVSLCVSDALVVDVAVDTLGI